MSGYLSTGCVTERTATQDRLSRQSIGAATVGQKPGAKEGARYHMMR